MMKTSESSQLDMSSPLCVSIPVTQTKSESISNNKIAKPFTAFVCEVRYQSKEWVVDRRYSDFLALHRALKAKFPAVVQMFANTFPKKKMLMAKTLDPRTIEERRVFFESYLKALVELSPRPGDVNAFLGFDPKEHLNTAEEHGLDDFEVLEALGSGAFGKVFLVRKIGHEELFAMKVLKKDEVKKRNQVEHTLTERTVMESISHPFIVPLRYSFQTKSRLYMVSEFCSGGELFYHLRDARTFPEDWVRFYIAEVLLALEHLHTMNIVYRDLKPENVLLDRDGHVRVTDFGLSKQNVTSNTGAKTYCGTPEYLAPEMIMAKRDAEQSYGFSVDWWSLGTFSFELFCGTPPFQDRNIKIMTERILTEKPRFPPNCVPTMAFRDFVNQLLQRDPAARLGMNGKARDHLFFDEVVWDDVLAKQCLPPIVPQIDPSYATLNFDPVEGDGRSFQSNAEEIAAAAAAAASSSYAKRPSLNNNTDTSLGKIFLRFVPKNLVSRVNNVVGPAAADPEVEDELTAMFKSFAFENKDDSAIISSANDSKASTATITDERSRILDPEDASSQIELWGDDDAEGAEE